MEAEFNVTTALTRVHPVTLTRGKNAHVWDIDNQRHIDFIGGFGMLNFGHCHPNIVGAIIDQAQILIHCAYSGAAAHTPYQTLMLRLCKMVSIDAKLSGLLTSCGTDAVETAIKIAHLKTGRLGITNLDGSLHRRTLTTTPLVGTVGPYHRGRDASSAHAYHVPFPSLDNDVSE